MKIGLNRCNFRYPAQEQVGGDAKIPTILYYDEAGNVQAVGAEALGDNVELEAQEHGWTKAQWQVFFFGYQREQSIDNKLGSNFISVRRRHPQLS